MNNSRRMKRIGRRTLRKIKMEGLLHPLELIIVAIFTVIIGIYIPPLLPSPQELLQGDNLSSQCFIDHYPPSLNKNELDKALRWEYMIDCDFNRLHKYSLCWASIQLKLDHICNISDYNGISFDIKAEKPIYSTKEDINTLELSIYTENNRNNENYQYWTGKNSSNMSIEVGRCVIELPFSELSVPEWTNKNNSVPRSPDLTKVSMITLDIPTNNRKSNKLWIYNTKLIHKNGSNISVTSHLDPLRTDAPFRGHWEAATGFKLIEDVEK